MQFERIGHGFLSAAFLFLQHLGNLGMDCGNRAGMLTARRVRPGAGVGGTVAAIFPSAAILSAALSLSALVACAMLQSDRIIRLANCFYLVLLKLSSIV